MDLDSRSPYLKTPVSTVPVNTTCSSAETVVLPLRVGESGYYIGNVGSLTNSS